ncbi:hypothetical protein M2306_002129 [Myroides gitamensis]|uniref:hypothetical protein n=1 Tax=Myroides odoratus TaxID=256 RepID=UPI00216A2A74|nr:hypothetical protein [Myroides odoratus]MCS4240401.1 hypothetical protein [Myroides odoratus]MDH6601435.1 hypothetical protein [Myroides gitamensis]
MKKLLVLSLFFMSILSINAQEIDLKAMTQADRIRYVSQEGTRALDQHLHEFMKKMYGNPNIMRPGYSAYAGSYKEILIRDEDVQPLTEKYGDFVTDYTFKKNDYIYHISFVANQRVWNPLLYRAIILNNGKALKITVLSVRESQVIYHK